MEISKDRTFKLSHHMWQKRPFDAKNEKDLIEYQYFLKHNKWIGNCPFTIEWPHLTITDMIRTKLIDTYLDQIVKGCNEK
jgi:hypothetical protein